MEQPDQQPPAPPPPPGARQKRGPSRATSAPSQPQAPHPETTVLWTDAGAARASPQPTTITSQQLPPTLQAKVERSDTLASQKTRPVSHIAAAAASLPKRPRIASQYGSGSGGGPRRGRTFPVRTLAECLASDNFSILEKWTLEHASKPYPTSQEKQKLAERCGLELNSVHTWFRNMRKRKFFHLERGSRPPADAFETQLLAFMKAEGLKPPEVKVVTPTAPEPKEPAPVVRPPSLKGTRYSPADIHPPRPLAPGERRVVVEPGVGGSFGVLLDRGEGCAIVAGFASDEVAEKTSLKVGEVVVAADRRRLAGAAWDDIVARIRCCGRAGEPLELVVRKPNRGLDAVLDAIEAVGH
mmetsp:Transcript_9442/g.29341  ORF Transcript_9442/g.29341 Transcript_9442/m.29341 type:complete len:355 (-) Transcript_9442:8-1072(-)